MGRRRPQRQPRRDRISELPADIVDQILGFLPIAQAARMAVLSTFWRDMWFSLTKLNFDCKFFYGIQRKYSHVHSAIRTQSSQVDKKNDDIWMSAILYVINKVLNQHNGFIRTFVIDFKNIDINKGMLRSRSFDLDQWLLFVTRKGVEEIHLILKFDDEYVGYMYYKLPNCIFSCPTLRRLHLCGVSVGSIKVHCTLPNVTSLCFEYVDFYCRGQTVETPMLESLYFMECDDITNFNLDLSSVRTLLLDSYVLKDFIDGFTRRGLQPAALNVEHLILSLTDNDITSSFTHLLRICPKLFKLDINSYTYLPQLSDDFYSVVQGHKMLYALKLTGILAREYDVNFVKRLLACFSTLEKVVIIRSKMLRYYRNNHEVFENYKEKLLHFLCGSTKAKIIIFDE